MSLLTEAIESSSAALVVIDQKGIILEASQMVCEIFGYQKNELINNEVETLIPSNLFKNHKKHLKKFFENPSNREIGSDRLLAAKRKDGKEIYVEIGLSHFEKDGNKYGVANIINNTEERQIKRLLQRTQNVARIGSWQLDLKSKKCMWSKMTYEIHELSPDTEIFLEDGINYYADEHQELIRSCVDRCISDQTPWDVELKIKTAKGNKVWVQAIGTPIVQNNQVIGLEGTFQDIDKRKLLELDKESILEKLVRTESSAKIGHWEWILEPESLTWSKGLYDIWGIPQESKVPTIEEHGKMIHPEDVDKFFETLKFAIENKRPYEVSFRANINGKQKNIRGEGTPIFDDSGKHMGFFGMAFDITKEIKQKDDQFENNKRLSLALKASKVGIWEWNVETDELIWDSQMYSLYGIKEEEFDGAYSAWIKGIHPDDKQDLQINIRKALETNGKFDTEFRALWPNQTVREIKALADTIYDPNGKPLKMIGVNWDITDLNRQARAIKFNNERYETMISGASVGIWDWVDVNKEKVIWTDKFFELLGYEPGEISSNLESFRDLLHPDDVERTFSAINDHFENNKPYKIEFRFRTNNSDYKWFLSSGLALRDKKGNPTRMVGSLQDIDERVRAEADLIKSNHDLDQFAYIASHDLREPLRGMRNFAQFLIEDYSEKLDKEGEQYLQTIKKLGDRLEDYLDSLLFYSRLGREKMAYKSCDLNSLVEEIKSVHLDPSDSSVKIVIPEPLPTLICDSIKPTIIFSNIIKNAARYNSNDQKEVVIEYKKLGFNDHMFLLTDNGIGIKNEHWDRIFILFKRLHPKDEYEGGSGIGLTAVKKAVERHGGTIYVEKSEVGKGTTIAFTIKEGQ